MPNILGLGYIFQFKYNTTFYQTNLECLIFKVSASKSISIINQSTYKLKIISILETFGIKNSSKPNFHFYGIREILSHWVSWNESAFQFKKSFHFSYFCLEGLKFSNISRESGKKKSNILIIKALSSPFYFWQSDRCFFGLKTDSFASCTCPLSFLFFGQPRYCQKD